MSSIPTAISLERDRSLRAWTSYGAGASVLVLVAYMVYEELGWPGGPGIFGGVVDSIGIGAACLAFIVGVWYSRLARRIRTEQIQA